MANLYLFLNVLYVLLISHAFVDAKFHHLLLKDEIRENVLLSKFGFDTNGTFDLVISNFTVPDAVIKTDSTSDKFVSIFV